MMQFRKKTYLVWILAVALLLTSSLAVAQAPAGVDILPEYQEAYDTLYANADIQKALAFIEADHAKRVEETIEMVQIPSPPFNEQARAEDFAQRFRDLGLADVHIDLEGNVIGWYRGTVGTPKLVVSAHMDTVFPPGYDTSVTIDEEGWIHAPGIADDAAGQSMLLSIVRALNHAQIKPVGDIMFVGTVGEEGRGDLRGVKYLFHNNKDIDGFISIDCDPEPPTVPYTATINALGSHRYEFHFKGPGGHSNGAFGTPSALQAAGRAIAHISDMQEGPRTTFTASVIEGGSSVNAIAEYTMLQTDLRCEDPVLLQQQSEELVACVLRGVAEENERWRGYPRNNGDVTVDVHLVGVRPSGFQDMYNPMVQSYMAMAESMPTFHPEYRDGAGSTDSNLPISLGVPSATIGRGGRSRGGHAEWENWQPDGAWKEVQAGFLLTVGLVGMDGVALPTLSKHPGYDYTFTGLPFIPDMYIVPGVEYKFSWVHLIPDDGPIVEEPEPLTPVDVQFAPGQINSNSKGQVNVIVKIPVQQLIEGLDPGEYDIKVIIDDRFEGTSTVSIK